MEERKKRKKKSKKCFPILVHQKKESRIQWIGSTSGQRHSAMTRRDITYFSLQVLPPVVTSDVGRRKLKGV
jgi:hypothetical protein